MASLEELSDVAEEEGSAVPEATGLFDNFVTSDSQIVFDYQVGFISFGSRPKVSIIGVCEVDQQALVAVPDLAWHRQKARRHMPDDALQKAVRVEARVGSGLDRTVPEDGTGIKIWLGFLKADYVDLVAYGLDALPDDILFPSDTVGLPMLPHAEALVAISHDHFVFLSAESGGAKPVYGTPDVEARLGQLEGTMAEILENLKQLKPGAASSRPSALHGDHGPRKPDPPRVSFAPPCGLDPHVVQQALMAGVSKKSLEEVALLLQQQNQMTPAAAPQAADKALVSDSDEEDEHLGAASGSLDPMNRAVVSLSKIVKEMRKEKKQKKDRDLESILDRAESGSAKDSVGSTRSKAAALRSLHKLLQTDPKLIYQAVEGHMQEDWEMGGQRLPGAMITQISARGWLEHRSRISSYPGTIRPAWLCAGIWDCLMRGAVDEARARAALATACFDQQACDRGGWLLASEMTLEPPPPYASFAQHSPPEQWEVQHTRLMDERWSELFLSRLKDLAEYQEKKLKLTATKSKKKEVPPKNDQKKGKGKGGKKGKEPEEAASSSTPQ